LLVVHRADVVARFLEHFAGLGDVGCFGIVEVGHPLALRSNWQKLADERGSERPRASSDDLA